MKKAGLIIIIGVLLGGFVLATDYNRPLTRSIADGIYCLMYGDCILNSLQVWGNITYINTTTYNITNMNATGTVQANKVLVKQGSVGETFGLYIETAGVVSRNNRRFFFTSPDGPNSAMQLTSQSDEDSTVNIIFNHSGDLFEVYNIFEAFSSGIKNRVNVNMTKNLSVTGKSRFKNNIDVQKNISVLGNVTAGELCLIADECISSWGEINGSVSGSSNDTQIHLNPPYLYNVSGEGYFNGTYGNETINASIDLRVNQNFLTNILNSVYQTLAGAFYNANWTANMLAYFDQDLNTTSAVNHSAVATDIGIGGGYTFKNNQDYRFSVDAVGADPTMYLMYNGNKYLELYYSMSEKITSNYRHGFPDGTAALPSIFFNNDGDTGIYRGATFVEFTYGGNTVFNYSNKEVELAVNLATNGSIRGDNLTITNNFTLGGYPKGAGFENFYFQMNETSNAIGSCTTDCYRMNLSISNTDNIKAIIYEVSGFTSGWAEGAWSIYLKDCDGTVHDTYNTGSFGVGAELTQAPAESWTIKTYIESPQANCDYAMNGDEKDGIAVVYPIWARIIGVVGEQAGGDD